MKKKEWYEVKVTLLDIDGTAYSRPMINETVAKVKSHGLAWHVKKLMEEIYVGAVVRVE